MFSSYILFSYYVDAANKTETKSYSVESLNQFISDELRNGFHGHEGKYYPGVVGEMGCTWVGGLLKKLS